MLNSLITSTSTTLPSLLATTSTFLNTTPNLLCMTIIKTITSLLSSSTVDSTSPKFTWSRRCPVSAMNMSSFFMEFYEQDIFQHESFHQCDSDLYCYYLIALLLHQFLIEGPVYEVIHL